MKKLTDREIQDWLAKIQRMEYEEMAVRWRFDPAGSPYFNTNYPQLYAAFQERFNKHFNGMRAHVSKHIGFDRDVWVGKYEIEKS